MLEISVPVTELAQGGPFNLIRRL